MLAEASKRAYRTVRVERTAASTARADRGRPPCRGNVVLAPRYASCSADLSRSGAERVIRLRSTEPQAAQKGARPWPRSSVCSIPIPSLAIRPTTRATPFRRSAATRTGRRLPRRTARSASSPVSWSDASPASSAFVPISSAMGTSCSSRATKTVRVRRSSATCRMRTWSSRSRSGPSISRPSGSPGRRSSRWS